VSESNSRRACAFHIVRALSMKSASR